MRELILINTVTLVLSIEYCFVYILSCNQTLLYKSHNISYFNTNLKYINYNITNTIYLLLILFIYFIYFTRDLNSQL